MQNFIKSHTTAQKKKRKGSPLNLKKLYLVSAVHEAQGISDKTLRDKVQKLGLTQNFNLALHTACFLFGFLLDPEDEGDIFFKLSANYTLLQTRGLVLHCPQNFKFII